MRYFISLSYDGTNYSGWQTQPDAPTVQETIEKALTLVSRSPEPIAIVVLGARTLASMPVVWSLTSICRWISRQHVS